MKKSFLILLFCFTSSCTNPIIGSNPVSDTDIFFYSNKSDKYQIYKFNVNKKEKLNISNDLNSNYSYTIDNNRKKIVYISSDKQSNLYVMDSDGSNKKKLSDKINCTNPVISPDGKQIAFISDKLIFVVNSDGSGLKQLIKNLPQQNSPYWSSDSKEITFEANNQLYLIDNNGINLKTLTKNQYFNNNPVISPDGKNIVFVSQRENKWNIYKINADGSNEIKISQGKEDIMPVWSNDSKKIAFVSKKDIKDESVFINQINVINSDGSNLKTINEDNQNSEPYWSEDGNFIVYSSAKEGNKDIFLINTKTLQEINITKSPENDFSPKL